MDDDAGTIGALISSAFDDPGTLLSSGTSDHLLTLIAGDLGVVCDTPEQVLNEIDCLQRDLASFRAAFQRISSVSSVPAPAARHDSDLVWTDPATNLTWMRDPLPGSHSWEQALNKSAPHSTTLFSE